jgi:DNA-binding FadR family transcriptional regulator
MIPRQWVPLDTMAPAEREKYVARMQREHRAILSAIRERNERAASRAMRTHLTKSYARFAELRDKAGRVRG